MPALHLQNLEQYPFVKDPQDKGDLEGESGCPSSPRNPGGSLLSPRTSTGGFRGLASAGNSNSAPPINLKHESSLVTPDLLEALRGSRDR